MTAAGTVVPSVCFFSCWCRCYSYKQLLLIKRMGAVAWATDVRMALKEQVESLGGKFLTVEGSENLETEGGYAKKLLKISKKTRRVWLSETLKKIDIVFQVQL